MRIIFFALFLLIMSPLIGMSYADEVAFCLKDCSYDRHTSDLNCPPAPPAGGSPSEERKQCLAANVVTYNECVKRCLPSSAKPDESGGTDQQEKDKN